MAPWQVSAFSDVSTSRGHYQIKSWLEQGLIAPSFEAAHCEGSTSESCAKTEAVAIGNGYGISGSECAILIGSALRDLGENRLQAVIELNGLFTVGSTVGDATLRVQGLAASVLGIHFVLERTAIAVSIFVDLSSGVSRGLEYLCISGVEGTYDTIWRALQRLHIGTAFSASKLKLVVGRSNVKLVGQRIERRWQAVDYSRHQRGGHQESSTKAHSGRWLMHSVGGRLSASFQVTSVAGWDRDCCCVNDLIGEH